MDIKFGTEGLPDFSSMTVEEQIEQMNFRGIAIYDHAILVVDVPTGCVLTVRVPDECYQGVASKDENGLIEYTGFTKEEPKLNS